MAEDQHPYTGPARFRFSALGQLLAIDQKSVVSFQSII